MDLYPPKRHFKIGSTFREKLNQFSKSLKGTLLLSQKLGLETHPVTALSRTKGDRIHNATPAQLRALLSPVKHEILNAVAAMGPISVAELARMIGRAPTALYVHIAKLERVGMLVRTESGSKRASPSILYPERASALYHTPNRRAEIDYKLADPKSRKLLASMVRSITATATRNFAKAARPKAVVAGHQRTLWASRWKRRLVPREIEALNRHLLGIERLMTQSSRGRARHKLIELTFVLAPAPDKTYRRRRQSR